MANLTYNAHVPYAYRITYSGSDTTGTYWSPSNSFTFDGDAVFGAQDTPTWGITPNAREITLFTVDMRPIVLEVW